MPIKVFVNKKENKITTIALAYLVKFDAYAYLKKRFKIINGSKQHYLYALIWIMQKNFFKVEIPELGMTFQYNNQDPLRQATWIFFKWDCYALSAYSSNQLEINWYYYNEEQNIELEQMKIKCH